MRPTQKLGDLIATHMFVPGHVKPARAETNFVMSGLRAATSASLINRRKILSDVSDVLNCRPEELDFMFSDFAMPITSPANYEVMVPDFQSVLLAAAE